MHDHHMSFLLPQSLLQQASYLSIANVHTVIRHVPGGQPATRHFLLMMDDGRKLHTHEEVLLLFIL